MPTDELPPPVVVRDVFPAEVTVGATVHRPARAIVTRDRVHVFIASNGAPTQVLDAPYDAATAVIPPRGASPRKGTHLTLSSDSDEVMQVHINRQGGCGCGNPLKVAAVTTLLPGARLGA